MLAVDLLLGADLEWIEGNLRLLKSIYVHFYLALPYLLARYWQAVLPLTGHWWYRFIPLKSTLISRSQRMSFFKKTFLVSTWFCKRESNSTSEVVLLSHASKFRTIWVRKCHKISVKVRGLLRVTDLASFTCGLRVINVHLRFIKGCYGVFTANIYDLFWAITDKYEHVTTILRALRMVTINLVIYV